MKKTILSILLVMTFGLGMGLSYPGQALAAESNGESEAINEKFGLPIVVYGENLTEDQKAQVQTSLQVDDPAMVEEITVNGQDLITYLGEGDARSRMFSSAKITRKDSTEGLVIEIVTPDNITEVTDQMYANALLTAGVEGAVVEIASPVKVTGHSALTGIYKAYDVDGEKLDTERMQVANEELNVATDLAQKEGLDQDKVSELLTEIKKSIAAQNPVSREEVEQIVSEQLNRMEIQLSPEDRQLLTDLFERMRAIDINFDEVQNQLEDIATDIRDRIETVAGDPGFWQSVADFFRDLFNAVSNLFNRLTG